MLRYGFIAAGNIIRAMHRGAELKEGMTLQKLVFTILTKMYVKIMLSKVMQHLIA